MPLKLKLMGGDSGKRSKTSQSNSTKTSSSNHSSSPDRKYAPASKPQRHHSSNVESVSETPPAEDFSPVFGGGRNNNFPPVVGCSPQSAPENWGSSPHFFEPRCRPKSVSEPMQPDEAALARSKDAKPGRIRAFSVSRSGKFKETKRRTSMLEIQDRFDEAARADGGLRDGQDES